MEAKFAKMIVDNAMNCDVELELREDYSGRGMYGNSCAGIVGDPSDIMLCVAMTAFDMGEDPEDEDFEDFCDDIRTLRSDNMGRDMIYY
jgi:hypothetical protein